MLPRNLKPAESPLLLSLKACALSLFLFLACLGLFEIASRALGAAPTAYERVFPILKTEQELGWHMKPGLSVDFFGAPLVSDEKGFRLGEKKESEQNIHLYGPSSAMGWGVPFEKTYGAIAAHLLTLNGESRGIKNFSQVGYSSLQGLKLLGRHGAREDATVIFAYGINDLDRFRFLYPDAVSDEEFFRQPLPWIKRLAALVQLKSAGFRTLRALLNEAPGICRFPAELPLRVKPEAVIQNLEKFLILVEEAGGRLIVMNTAYRAPGPESETDSDSASLFRAAGRLSREGECEKAKAAFSAALLREPARISADVELLNKTLAAWAEAKKIPLVDTYSLMNREEHFLDPVHFSATGNEVLGRALAREIYRQKRSENLANGLGTGGGK